ncbi:MAG: nitroreductase family protein [Acidobacteria bacterium]|nr:nitroreductase family protein [Acidobacteriota bacterium]
MATVTGFSALDFQRLPPAAQMRRAAEFYELLCRRRTVREFAPDPVPLELIELAIKTAATAPSGANQQPWFFAVVSNPEIKRRIRVAAEAEEYENYNGRFPDDWLQALAQFGTDWHKEFLEVAPYLIVVFKLDYGIALQADGSERKLKHYYVNESVGIATGMLLAALHNAGLVTLTHTPNPMGFLTEILGRPKNERPFLLIPVGYPTADARVPNIGKKPLDDVMSVLA